MEYPRVYSALAQVFITQTHLAIAMEYAQGGDMFKYICRHKPHCRLLENQARWIFQQLIIGLDYCHSKARTIALCSVSVCNIRPSNTLRVTDSSGQLKLHAAAT